MIIIIDGSKDAFVSKNAVDKFKNFVKNNKDTINIDDLNSKYIKPEFKLELTTNTNEQIVFKVISIEEINKIKQKELLKSKLRLMCGRANNFKDKDNLVPSDVLKEYIKLKNMVKMPIPEPGEIFSKPEQYRHIISMVLGNSMMSKLGSKHPYVRYFTLIAQHLGIEPQVNLNNVQYNMPDNIQELINASGTIQETSLNNDDTDTEED